MTFGERKTRIKSDPVKVREWQDRSRKALPSESPKRKSERRTRAKVLAAARARDRGCIARFLVPEIECRGPLDGDERCPRSVYPGGHLDLDNVQMLCRAHHDDKGARRPHYEALGLYRSSWNVS